MGASWTRKDIIICHCNRIIISNARNCSISITALSPADLGTWTCRVHHSASSTWQEAHVEVATRDQDDINVRLPANVRPSRYSITFAVPEIILSDICNVLDTKCI